MNVKEAKRDIERHKTNKCDCCFPGGGICEHLYAEGYLSALEGPEVKALVEALELYFEAGVIVAKQKMKEALAQYREAIKK